MRDNTANNHSHRVLQILFENISSLFDKFRGIFREKDNTEEWKAGPGGIKRGRGSMKKLFVFPINLTFAHHQLIPIHS